MSRSKFYHIELIPNYQINSLTRLKDSTNEKINEIIRNYFSTTINTADSFNVVVGYDKTEKRYKVKKLSIPRWIVSTRSKATMEAFLLADKINKYLDNFSKIDQKP